MEDLLSCAMMPLVASRLTFPEVAADWDLGEYLHGDMKTAFEDPSILRVPDPPALPQGKISKRQTRIHEVRSAGRSSEWS